MVDLCCKQKQYQLQLSTLSSAKISHCQTGEALERTIGVRPIIELSYVDSIRSASEQLNSLELSSEGGTEARECRAGSCRKPSYYRDVILIRVSERPCQLGPPSENAHGRLATTSSH
jgi:hypothetical protein